MYHYVYITTNLINGKQYVGDHSTDNLNDTYLGSGNYLKKSIKKHGKEKFEREILEFFDTKQEAFDAQEKWINEHNTILPNGYNLSPTGGHGTFGGNMSEETKRKISEGNRGKKVSKETKEKMSKSLKGRVKSLEERKNIRQSKLGKKNPMFGKNLTEETKKKMSKSHKGQVPWNKNIKLSKETKEKMSNSGKIKIFTEDHKKKISLSYKEREKIYCIHCNEFFFPQHFGRWHGSNCKRNKEYINKEI